MQNTLTPWSTIGYITYKRTYSRRLNEADINSPTEEFEDTVNRVVEATNNQLGCGFTSAEQERQRCQLRRRTTAASIRISSTMCCVCTFRS